MLTATLTARIGVGRHPAGADHVDGEHHHGQHRGDDPVACRPARPDGGRRRRPGAAPRWWRSSEGGFLPQAVGTGHRRNLPVAPRLGPASPADRYRFSAGIGTDGSVRSGPAAPRTGRGGGPTGTRARRTGDRPAPARRQRRRGPASRSTAASNSANPEYQTPPPLRRTWPTRTSVRPWATTGRPWAQASVRTMEKLSKNDGWASATAPARPSLRTSSSTNPV